jgi:succinate-semialdehyde dehydrogenase/glutarate-semialdehyde dehydrogenase
MNIVSINPANGKPLKKYSVHTPKQVEQKIAQTHKTWLSWKNTGHDERSRLLNNLAGVLENRKKEFAILMAQEMGKPIAQGVAEIEKCASVCEYYATNAAKFLSDQLIETGASKSFVSFQPIGLVLAIMPWNFPFWQVFRFLVPALAADNCAVLKHASNVPGCALAIEEVVQ